MSRKLIAAGMIIPLIVAGCAPPRNEGPITGITPDQARQLNGERNPFETSADPPITADTHFAAGQLSEAQNDLATAAKQYSEAMKLDPKHIKSLYRLGVCYSHLKKHNLAAATWKSYIELTGSAVGYSNLGFCYELAGQIELAEPAYRQGIERDPRSVPCRTNYGLMLARLGRYGEATVQLQAVLSPAEVHYNLASVYECQGRREQAKLEYQKALELDPSLDDARTRLAALGEE